MSEIEKLKRRLKGTKNFGVSWGPDAYLLSPEQKAKQINLVLDEIAAGNYTDMEPIEIGPRRRLAHPKIDLDDLEQISSELSPDGGMADTPA